MTQEQKTAVFRLTLESLQRDREEWMPWIAELEPKQMRNLLFAILEDPSLTQNQAMTDRLLILLGTLAYTMTPGQMTALGPSIQLARNRTLAARMPLPPE